MEQIETFFSDHQLLLNLSKTNYMNFNAKTNNNLNLPTVYIEGIELKKVENTKFLGLHMDSKLSWDYHIDQVANRISSGLFALYRMSKFCKLEPLKLLIFLIFSYI